MNRRLIRQTAAGCCRAFYQLAVVLRLINGRLRRSLTHAEVAAAKRDLEGKMRDSGLSKSNAVRIAGKTLCRFKRYVKDSK